MTDINIVTNLLKDRKLTNIFVSGYLDKCKSTTYFHPMLRFLYLQFEDIILEVSSVDQYWNVEIAVVDHIKCKFEIDEDDEFCISSIYQMVVNYPDWENMFDELQVFAGDDSRLDKGVVRRVALRLKCRGSDNMTDTIFIDPQNTFGIKLGGEIELGNWKAENLLDNSGADGDASPGILREYRYPAT
jgi:hypothetical protein